jgi:hypothetical protein
MKFREHKKQDEFEQQESLSFEATEYEATETEYEATEYEATEYDTAENDTTEYDTLDIYDPNDPYDPLTLEEQVLFDTATEDGETFTQEQYESDGGVDEYYEEDAQYGEQYEEQDSLVYYEDTQNGEQDSPVYYENENKPNSYNYVLDDLDSHRLGIMDMVLLGAGGLLLIFVVITAVFFFQKQSYQREMQAFLTVGRAIDDIDIIGGEGMEGVETLLRNSNVPYIPPLIDDDPGGNGEYNENEYSQQVTVALNMVSIQKDLKIKFVNRSTGKLILNVPFTVEVNDPDGAAINWSDEDLDGIIYEKDIKPGIYTVRLQQLDGDKYANYILPGERESIDVRKYLVYQKVDVSNEIKV